MVACVDDSFQLALDFKWVFSGWIFFHFSLVSVAGLLRLPSLT